MSALRTLRRRQARSHQRMTDEGKLVDYTRRKPGSFDRRILAEVTANGRTYRYHATKGIRINRAA